MQFNLIKDKWTKTDGNEFVNYLNNLSKGQASADMEKRILNTNYPCIAVSCKDVDMIVREIYKGNFLSFIDLWLKDNHTCLLITGKLIAKIKDISLQFEYLETYLNYVDSWAGCDSLRLKIKEKNYKDYFDFSNKLISSQNPFRRRFALIILFKLINDDYIDRIIQMSSSLAGEEDYYVNMANAWLIAECFLYYQEKIFDLLKSKTLNKFVQNKSISKCCDSFRVTKENKLKLKNFRVK